MKKTLKPQGHKGRFSFLNKQKIFRKLLKNLVSSYNDLYYIVTEDSSYSDVTGDIHFLLHERSHRVHSMRTINLFYKASNHTAQLNFYRAILPKSLWQKYHKTRMQFIKKNELSVRTIMSTITDWFEKERVQGYKVHVVFRTEFPLFNYKKTFCVDSIGMVLAKEIVEDIFKNEISKNNTTEIERFRNAFRTAKHMFDSTLHCSVISLATDKEVAEHADNCMSSEIGNQIYARLAPAKQPDTLKVRKGEYFKTLISFISNWWQKNTLQGRVQ